MNLPNSLPGPLTQRTILVLLVIVLGASRAMCAASSDEARVTKIVRDVKLLPTGAKAKPATINAEVNADTGVRTGDRSRSELTFGDLTIERLGANTLFHFDKAGRSVELESGSMLLRVPKDSGGAQMQTRAVTVGITGTTVILETTSAGRNKLYVLEGGARLSLNRYPRESVNVRGGQMEDVPAGATKLPPPVNVDLNDIMQQHPLITDFGPLPSQDLIYTTMRNPPSGQPSGGGPGFIPPIIGNILGGSTIGIGPQTGGSGTRGGRAGNRRDRTGGQTGGQTGTANSRPLKDVGPSTNKPTKNKYPVGTTSGRPTPTPTPTRKPKTG
jgi:hypothetical protein